MSGGKRGEVDTIHHLIALFCTVSAKQYAASTLTTIFYNEINDLEANLKARDGQNRSK
jgi:hypothetical protein